MELLFRGMEDLSDEDVAVFRAAPSWAGRVAAAHTISREVRGEATAPLDEDPARTITVPLLLVTGDNSADPAKPYAEVVAGALPNARVLVLDGHGHLADVLDPEFFASRVLPFLTNTRVKATADEERS